MGGARRPWTAIAAGAVIAWALFACEDKTVYVVSAPVTDDSDAAAPGAGGPSDAAAGADAGHPLPDTGASADPCGIVPAQGVCIKATTVATCVVATGNGKRSVVTQDCPAQDECKVGDKGARCVPKAGRCDPGASECVSTSQGRNCGDDGNWSAPYGCPGCVSSPLGNLCTTAVATTAHTGGLDYEFRGPNAGLTDWSAITTSPAPGFLVVSYSWNAAGGFYVPLDATVSDGSGNYTIQVPQTPGAEDILLVLAVGVIDNKVAYGVGRPEIPDGTWPASSPIPDTANSSFWSWSIATTSLGASGTRFTITEALGSGAARVFDVQRFVERSTRDVYGKGGRRLVVWLRYGTAFDCGSCEIDAPTTFVGQPFDSQIFLSGLAADQAYWSDSVTAHEHGHWVMSSYGFPGSEGGPHQEACPTLPGQAWSEGWATGLSSLVRGSSIYTDKQEGTFFWIDVSTKVYGDGLPWTDPTANAAGGVYQFLDENAVAAMIWRLASDHSGSLETNATLLSALASPRMLGPTFARGYTTHTWDGACDRTNIVDTQEPAPMLADYLDALVCGGVSTSVVSAAIGNYPYSAPAVCQ